MQTGIRIVEKAIRINQTFALLKRLVCSHAAIVIGKRDKDQVGKRRIRPQRVKICYVKGISVLDCRSGKVRVFDFFVHRYAAFVKQTADFVK